MTERLKYEKEPVDFQKMESEYTNAFFQINEESLFSHFTAEQLNIRPGEETIDKEIKLRHLIDEMFSQVARTFQADADEVKVPTKTFDTSPDFVTFSGAVLDLKSINQFPREQLWVAEWGLHQMDENDPRLPQRKDKQIETEIVESLNTFFELRERDTARAAEEKSALLSHIHHCLQTPIEGYLIQYQSVEGKRTYNPKIGMRMVRYIKGWQIYPISYQAKNAFTFYDNPILAGKKVHISSMQAEINVNLVDNDDFLDSDWNKVGSNLVDKAGFSQ